MKTHFKLLLLFSILLVLLVLLVLFSCDDYDQIPLEIRQKLIKGKINTSIIGGISYLILDKAALYTDGIQNNLQIETIENSNMSVNLGLSFDTLIIKKLHFVVEPIFKYHFKPLENRLDSKTFTLSVLGGLEYKF